MAYPEVSMFELLVKTPPYVSVVVMDLLTVAPNTTHLSAVPINTPDIIIHCDNALCSGERVFRSSTRAGAYSGSWSYVYLTYKCSNCNINTKVYSLAVRIVNDSLRVAEVIKIGEIPDFGPPIPSRALSLIGSSQDLFLKGRKAENQGLGIAAFIYYRRIVEDQWQKLIGEIIKVAKRTQDDEALVALLEKAKAEDQFRKAVSMIGDGIPNSIKLSGHNPLTLLYAPLSEGIHSKTDDECLALAHAIRTVLYELAEKISSALKEHGELKSAISQILNRNNPKSEKST